ncbi:MAG: hypothetical protein E4H27_03710 [Anaerolineales bacterium]|nr:MAG: hypothetical protein E4H27_03710 [Anaerolineales bacterium]
MALGVSLIVIVLVVLVVVLAVLLIGLGKDALGALRKHKMQDQDSEALQILKKRLTRGEICIEEYNALREQITQ